jgi:hypothetical protein
MRAWFSGKTLAFQANDAGSIPAARFEKKQKKRGIYV